MTLGSNIQTLESRRRHLMEKKNNYRKRYNDEMKKYKRLDTDVTEIAQEIRDFDSKLTASHKETAELDAIDCHRLFLGQGHCLREVRGSC